MPAPSSPPPGPERRSGSPSSDPGDRPSGGDLGEWARTAGLGLTFAVTVGLFAWGGLALDDWLGTRPVFLIVGVLVGFVGALISMVKRLPPGGSSPPRSDS